MNYTPASRTRARREPFAAICPYAVPEPGVNETWDEIQRAIAVARRDPECLDAQEWRFLNDMDGLRLLTAPQLRRYVDIFRKLLAIQGAAARARLAAKGSK